MSLHPGPPLINALRWSRPKPRRGPWLFLTLAPLIVVLVALAVGAVVSAVGLRDLARVSSEQAGKEASLFADAVAARVGRLGSAGQLEAMQLAARRTGAEFLLVGEGGDLLFDASLGAPEAAALRRFVAQRNGVAQTRLGRTRFAVAPVPHLPAAPFLVAFVRDPEAPDAAAALVKALTALIVLLVGVAASVAWVVARDANRDVAYVTARVRGMAVVRSEPTGEPVPVRTMDEVGALTSAFNDLVGRFSEAEKSYLADLSRVRAADHDRSAFLASVSHELRTPLNAILGFADVLMAEVDGPLTPSAREEVEQIRASGQHLLDLITDILEFSAIESGQLNLARSCVDLGAIAAGVVRESLGSIGDKPVKLAVEASADVLAYADGKRVRQLLTNLVANAVKFTDRGEVLVRVERNGPYARATVRDTGPGISAAERAMIFEEYRQGRDERVRRRGTGLGLAIARRLALAHGGSIRVESELGRGSTFIVDLPVWFEGAR